VDEDSIPVMIIFEYLKKFGPVSVIEEYLLLFVPSACYVIQSSGVFYPEWASHNEGILFCWDCIVNSQDLTPSSLVASTKAIAFFVDPIFLSLFSFFCEYFSVEYVIFAGSSSNAFLIGKLCREHCQS